MKKNIKIIITILTILAILFTVKLPTSLAAGAGVVSGAVSGAVPEKKQPGANPIMELVDDINPQQGITDKDLRDTITGFATTITGVFWVASIVISICVLVYIGIMYIMASPSKKADYKATLTPLIVGIGLVVMATSIINFIFGGFGAK